MKKSNKSSKSLSFNKKQMIFFTLLFGVLVSFYNYIDKDFKEKTALSSVENKKNNNYPDPLKSQKNSLKKRAPSNVDLSKLAATSKKAPKTKSPFESHLNCIHEQNCDLPDDDPKAYMFAAYKNLSVAIKENKSYFLTNWNNTKATLLKSFLKLPDGFVKNEALQIALELNHRDSQGLLTSVVDDVLHYHDAELVEDSLKFLSQTMTTENEHYIYSEVGKALSTGSPVVGEALAQNIDVLLNPRSVETFKNVASKLPPGSAEKVFLNSSIKEFEMRQSGG